ncbi:hypothetical protein PYW07_010375 [Mythimna separata]|uniref:Serpin domain-containing protein n=1 Tax=Mythimna separata TaxID=271217 RepID=A0AAD7YAH5_MYTSE|nr:hypothetical protein PYW07_010375 [Mythimna separata]
MELVKRINKETESHFVTSALTPWTLLLVMSLGGSNTTRQEIQEVLHLPHKSCFVYLYLELVTLVTMKPTNPVLSMFERGSTIFFNASESPNQHFFDVLSKAGIYSSRIMYFMDQNETAQSINEHVKSFTDGSIQHVLKADDLDGLSILTIDAVTFRGAWKVPFPYEDTATGVFYNDKGEPIGHISLMYLCASYKVLSIPQIRAKVLELPYFGDHSNGHSMLIFLPDYNVSVTTTLELMMKINVRIIFKLYELSKPRNITVQIPRFNISSRIGNWKELLISMGIKGLFEEEEGDFPGVTNYQLFLTNLIQKAELQVNEEGMEVGRPTATLMQSRFMYDEFVANKPFLFMIADRIQHVPIIMGAYTKPSFFSGE